MMEAVRRTDLVVEIKTAAAETRMEAVRVEAVAAREMAVAATTTAVVETISSVVEVEGIKAAEEARGPAVDAVEVWDPVEVDKVRVVAIRAAAVDLGAAARVEPAAVDHADRAAALDQAQAAVVGDSAAVAAGSRVEAEDREVVDAAAMIAPV
jgi:hypothetical protein